MKTDAVAVVLVKSKFLAAGIQRNKIIVCIADILDNTSEIASPEVI